MPEKEKSVVPRLRFPEFRDAGEWERYRFRELLTLEYGASLPEESRLGGMIPVVGSNGVVGFHNQALISGPVIIVGRKGSVGEINWIESDCYPIDTTFYVKLESQDTLLAFIKLLLENANLACLSDNGAVPGLNRNDVYVLKTALPREAEQQKIANCLASLDEVINLQTQKLDALKAHKKGLMQQLFPREGETTPRLRFPEFRDAGEWEVKRLGDVVKVTGGGTPSTKIKEFWDGSIPWVSSSDIAEDSVHGINVRKFITEEAIKNSATRIVPANSILLVSRVGVGKLAVSRRPMCTSQDFTNLTPVKDDALFLAYCLKAIVHIFESFNQGMAIKGFTKEDVENLQIALPNFASWEQQKIADCLSSLDEVIDLEAQKLDALKAHKKGLMQQLFPQEVD